MNDENIIKLENHPYDEIAVGDTAAFCKRLTKEDVALFAIMSGDVNPAHLDAKYAESTPFHEVIAHGMWGGALISRLLGTQLPGPGTLYLAQTLEFHRPVRIGDEIKFSVTVLEKQPRGHRVVLDCVACNLDGERVITGRATVKAPTVKMVMDATPLPEFRVLDRKLLAGILKQTEALPKLRAAVVHPVTAHVMLCIEAAIRQGVVAPTLVGPKERIEAAARAAGVDLGGMPIVHTPHSHAAAERAVRMVADGEMDTLIKGSLHTHELLEAVLDRKSGLRTDRRISHVYVFDVPTYERLLIITDAAINIAPGLVEKVDIVKNAVGFAHAIGIAKPRVAILSAVETINPKIPSTTEAAALCKMADRGQITGAILDGPLAFDNAISAAAANIKGIVSEVAGQADILVAPDLEAGNMVAKQLEYLADAAGAGLLLGARVPIVLTSRADQPETMAVSCALAALMDVRRKAAAADEHGEGEAHD